MTADLPTLLAIVLMAVATYLTRIGGFWLIGHFSIKGRLAGALDAVPGSVLTALIAPMALATGPAESGAALITVLLALRLPMIAAVVGGVAAVVGLRAILG